jgi:hypothetical protein
MHPYLLEQLTEDRHQQRVSLAARLQRRDVPSALWAGVAGIGVALGPVTGGYLLSHF